MNDILRRVADEFGTPCYVYFMDQVRDRVAGVRAAFGDRFRISFAVKSNPNHGLLQRMLGVVDALDVSSVGEVARAMAAGWAPGQLGFTGPGKTAAELQAAVQASVGEMIVESQAEAELLDAIAGRAGRRQRILVRIAPRKVPRGFGLNMSGKPSQFGIDEEAIDPALEAIQALPHLELCGFHIYSGTQCLKAEAIVENFAIFIDVFTRVCRTHRVTPQRLIFGAGFGIPYYENDTPVELAAIAEGTNARLDALKADTEFSGTELMLESGRYLVGEAGVYLTRVVRKKHSRGTDICICDGGMHHHLAAAGHLGSVVQRNYQIFKITGDTPQAAEQGYNLVGPLCTTIDTLGRQVKFSGLDAGDVIGIRCSGAYGPTASPIHFISHAPPREIIVDSVQGRLCISDATQFDEAGEVR